MDDRTRSPLRFDRFTLDPARGCLLDGTAEIPLRPKAYDVLRHLAERADHLVSKDEMMAAVWPGVFVTDDSLVHAVAELRKALGDRDQRIVRTVPRRGYRFVAPVTVLSRGRGG
jgi:adenylate cyclase